MSLPTIDVVILTWNDGDLLMSAINSVLESEGVEVRLVVVDNASSEQVHVPLDPRITLLRNSENRGVAIGRNQGAAAGGSPFLAFLDSDARLLPLTLRQLVEPMLADERIAVTVPVFVDQAPTESAGRNPTIRVKLQRALGQRVDYEPLDAPTGSSWAVDFGIGACQLVRRSAFEVVHGLDESIHFGPEDLDFCLRMKERGFVVLQVATGCIHPPRRRFRRPLSRSGLRHASSVARFYWKRRSTRVR